MIGTVMVMSAASCNAPKHTEQISSNSFVTTEKQISNKADLDEQTIGAVRAKPFAFIYKTNGNYNDKVTAVYDKSRDMFLSFPDPTDVSPDFAPLELIDGWLLDRRGGVGENTVFLRWTYGEYSKLKSVPSIDELRKAIIPDAKVTEFVRLNMTSFEAQGDTARVNALIRNGLPESNHYINDR